MVNRLMPLIDTVLSGRYLSSIIKEENLPCHK
jgi:hypothetical protein